MRNTSARFPAAFGRFLILLLTVSLLATCFTGCFEYDPLGKETQGGSPAFDPDGNDEPDQPTDATDPIGATDGTEPTGGTQPIDPTDSTEGTEATTPTEPSQPTTPPTEPPTEPATKPTEAPVFADPIAYGMVTADELNVRLGPGTNYNAVGKLMFNTRVAIYARNGKWGQTSEGWISLNFVYIDGQPGNVTDGAATITGDYVNIRSGPGTNYGILRGTRQGDKITILHIVTINNRKWGCTSNGWICMDYVMLEKDKPEETEPAETEPAETEPVETESTESTTSSETQNANVTGEWVYYTMDGDKLKRIKYIFESDGRYTYSEWICWETDQASSNVQYEGKYWKGEPNFGWNGSYSVSGTTVTFISDAQTEVPSSTFTGTVSGNTLTVKGINYTKE